MNIDLSTILGFLGVILTIAFFVFGYRQTIGARKERAASANKEIVDVLLRRSTLDHEFSMSAGDIENFISGKAIDNRVKRRDIYSLSNLLVVLYSKVVSSDYLAARQRRLIAQKIADCLSPPPQEVPDIVPKVQADSQRSRDFGSEALLALTSVIMATVATGFAANFFADIAEPLTALRIPLLVALIGSVLTGLALLVFVKVREKSTETKQPGNESLISDTEQQIMRLLSLAEIPFSKRMDIDFIARINDSTIGIEVKRYLPHSLQNLRRIVNRAETLRDKYGLEQLYLVFAGPIPPSLKEASTDRVKVTELADLSGHLGVPQGHRKR